MNDNVKVFAIPATLVVEATVYVLARSADHAAKLANAIDLEDYIAFTPSALRTDDEGVLKINDVITHPMNVTVVDITALTTEEYPPNQHPDFVPIRR